MRITWRTMRSTMRSRSCGGQGIAQREVDAEAARDVEHRLLDAGHSLGPIFDDEAAADGDRDGGENLAFLDQSELGGAAADIDIEHGVAIAARHRDGAGAVRRHLAFHMVAGGGADERSGYLRKQFGNRACVMPLDRLAGQDDGAGVDVVGIDLGEVVAAAEEFGEVVGVDGVVRQIGRQLDRRLPHDLALDHDEAARQRGAEPLQMHQRKHQVRRRGADVDADGSQLDVIGCPSDLVDLVIRNVVQVVEFEVVHRALWRQLASLVPAKAGTQSTAPGFPLSRE